MTPSWVVGRGRGVVSRMGRGRVVPRVGEWGDESGQAVDG